MNPLTYIGIGIATAKTVKEIIKGVSKAVDDGRNKYGTVKVKDRYYRL